jgi:hypothetical protein
MSSEIKPPTRTRFYTIPNDGLAGARSVMLDWNISSRLEQLHRHQSQGESSNLSVDFRARLLWLVDNTSDDTSFVTGLSAAESEVRVRHAAPDVERYTSRSDIAALYLGTGRPYLQHLLNDGSPAEYVLPASGQGAELGDFENLQRFITVGYAALLKASEISLTGGGNAKDNVDAYRFWLEHELQFAPSREAWLGFVLLGGSGSESQKVARILKLESKKKTTAERVWGAAWDVFYTRMVNLAEREPFSSVVQTPLVFVTDDEGLAEAMASIAPVGSVEADKRLVGAEVMNTEALRPEVVDIVFDYTLKARERMMESSRGVTEDVMRRARSLAHRIERDLVRKGF